MTETKKCIECGEDISINAEICPKCGVRQFSNKHTAEKVGAGLGAAAGAGAAIAGAGAAVTAAGTGAGAVAVTTGLAAIGGTMLGGIGIIAAAPVVAAAGLGAAGYGIAKLVKNKRNKTKQLEAENNRLNEELANKEQ